MYNLGIDDSALWPKGTSRCRPELFWTWMMLPAAIGAWSLLSVFLCLWKGLNQTGMNDYYAFGLWIVVDLAVIALGAGAFFTSFLLYVLGIKELKNVINLAVLKGFICYSGAIVMLGVDIGQPIRGWFGFWHANIHSMLTEVMFCITIYCMVLMVELLPTVLENRKIVKIPEFGTFAHNMHRIMVVFAATGTFLSFFHQGSLGGMFGVLYARPFAYRGGLFIWPWTFFLFVLSVFAAGPSFLLVLLYIFETVTGKKLTTHKVKMLMGKIAGVMMLLYMVLKLADTFYWIYFDLPRAGVTMASMYQGAYGQWLLWAELLFCGVVPTLMLLTQQVRASYLALFVSVFLVSCGAVLNRFVFTIQGLAIPVLPFEGYEFFWPTWQEWGVGALVLAYGLTLMMLAYRYLPLFPQEAKLNKPKEV